MSQTAIHCLNNCNGCCSYQFSSIVFYKSIYFVEKLLYNQHEITRTDYIFLLSSDGQLQSNQNS